MTYGTEINVNALYRHSRSKQYLNDGRALRIETVVKDPGDLGCPRRLCISTSDGLRFAIFHTKVHDRLLRLLLTAD